MNQHGNTNHNSSDDDDHSDGVSSSSGAVEMADRNLLFGIVAVQMNFISREGLISAMKAWVLDKHRLLSDLLLEQQLMLPEHRKLLEPLIAAFIREHDNDPKQCLAALSSITSIKKELDGLKDPDVTLTLCEIQDVSSSQRVAGGNGSETSSISEIRFQIIRPYAKGGLGQVSVALDKELNREVALKGIQKKHLDNSANLERFVLEAEITGGLQHPGIVPVYGLGHFPDGSPFYAMRFIRGESLKAAIEEYHQSGSRTRNPTGRRRLELRKLLRRFIDVCNAVEYAHSRGVLHRDLKPGNIMLGKYGETLVVDWGLAKASGQKEIESDEPTLKPKSLTSSSGQTRQGSLLGTPAYMSPEQAAGKLDQLGAETDVYSLGATLFHLLAGRAPFAGKALEVIKHVRNGNFVSPRKVVPEISPALEAICLKAMSLKPRDRYQTARLLADDLERWLADEPVTARSETWPERLSRLERKHRTWVRAGTASMAVITALSIVAALWINVERDKNAKLAISESAAKVNAESAKQIAMTATENALKEKAFAEAERARADLNADAANRKSEELQVQLAKTHFQHGVAEFDAGRTDLAIRDLTTALKVLPAAHELRSAVECVIMDRVSIGNKSIPVQSRTLSPDGTRSIEFALKEGKIRYHVIDVNTPKAVGIALQDDDGTGQMAFSSDSKRVIKSQSGKIRVWDAATGLLTSQLDVPPSTGAIAFTQDGRRVVTGLWDKSARLWDLQSGTQIGKSMAHNGPVDYVAISSDGLRIVKGSRQDSSARLWDGVTAMAVGEPLRHGGNIHCLNFSHDGSRVVTGGSDNTVRLWDASNGQAVGSPLVHESNVIGVEFSPDDRSLVSAAGKSAHLWNWRNGTRFCDPLIHQDNLWSVKFSPDGMRVATLSTEGSVALWNAQDGKSLGRQLNLGDKSGKIQFHPDGTRIFSNGRSVEAFPIEPVSESIPTEGNVADLKFSPDGKRILAAVRNSIRAWDSITHAPLGELVRDELHLSSFAISKDGKRLITGTLGGTKEKETTFVRLWNAETGVPLGMPMEHPKLVRHVAFSHDDTRITTGCFDGGVRLWDGVTCALIGTAFAQDGVGAPKLSVPVRSVEFSPDGKRLVVVIGSKTEIWDAATLKLERTIGHWLQPTIHLAPDICPDGTRLVTAGGGKAQVWDLLSGIPIGEPMWCQYNTVTGAVKFSPDGLIVVTAMERQARIWDARTGVELREPFYHHPQINDLAFSPDGTRLLTSGADQTIRIWDISPLPRPKDVPEWIRTFTSLTLRLLEERPRPTSTMPPVAKPQPSVPFREREAEWYIAVTQRQARNCRQFQLSAAREAEALKNWFAAEFHLRHLSLAEPDNVQFRNRLQIARQNLK